MWHQRISGNHLTRRLAVFAGLILAITASTARSVPFSARTDCNQPTPEPIAWVDLPSDHAFQALPTKDGCWIFVSLATGKDAASDSDPATSGHAPAGLKTGLAVRRPKSQNL
jgi:hypothetical protein